jgi:antitoxin (DNA-binding transcriptional repressor) of toxin-antitoxin stability system
VFRTGLGRWIDRVSAGKDVLVTRRGKAVMRLTAADPPTVPRSGNQALPAPEIADGTG